MQYRKLGGTGLEISTIGFGAWGIGGDSYGKTEDNQSIQAVHAALDAGITFFDTSDLYGQGRSEALLGSALQGRRDQAILCSKVGSGNGVEAQDFSPKEVRRAIEASLDRLKTDYLDLYLLHSPAVSDVENEPQLLATLEDLKREGKIRAYGISARSPVDAMKFISDYGIQAVQVNFNLLDQRAKDVGLFELAEKAGAGIIIRTPLCFGFLTGKYEGMSFPEGDHRSLWSEEQIRVWAEGFRKFISLQEDPDAPATRFALRFCLSQPGVSCAIPGILTADQAIENADAGKYDSLSASILSQCEEVFKGNQFFLGAKPHST